MLLSIRIVSMLLSKSIVCGQMLLSISIVSLLLSISMVSGQMLLSIRIVIPSVAILAQVESNAQHYFKLAATV